VTSPAGWAADQPTSWEQWVRARADPRAADAKPEALEGLLVLQASQGSLGAFLCGTFLAEFGAEVIALEPPGGDPLRGWTPFGLTHRGEGLAMLAEGRNKFYVTLNLGSAEGRELFGRLAGKADIVIEGFPPGRLDAWGVGYRQLREANRRLIYAAFSTFGHFGPRAGEPVPEADVVAQALSGLAYLTGEPPPGDAAAAGAAPPGDAPDESAVPTKAGCWFAGYAAGAWGAFGILAALHHRMATGEGQMIDIAAPEAIMRFLEYNLLWYHLAGRVRERVGVYDPAVFPYTFVRVKDGYAMIAAYTDANFAALCRIMGRPELAQDPRFRRTVDRTRPEYEPALRAEIEAWSARYAADEILAKVLADPGPGTVVFGRVSSPGDVAAEANWWERGALARVTDPLYGELTLQMPAARLTATPPRVTWPCRPVGYHNGHVYLTHLGLGPAALAGLRERGVV
jgi:crotonobetainyl-CoA:carnitine CoA-transferase CaiB-like acyl-CoA transferase